jgi:hypothetical protein
MSDLQDVIAHNAQKAYQQGVTRERERIIYLAKERICFDNKVSCEHGACYSLADFIDLIKGEQK